MSTLVRLSVLVIGFGVAPVSAASSGPVIGVVVEVHGEPLLDGKPFKKNAFVYAGSALETRAGGCAAVALVSGAEVRLDENSDGRLDGAGGRRAASVSLYAGRIWARVLPGKTGLEIHGPHAMVALGGAQADVAVGSRTVVKVYEGSADVANEGGKATVAARQRTQVDAPGEAPRVPTSLLPQDSETWQDACAGSDGGKNTAPRRSGGPSLRIRPKPVTTP